MTPPRSAFPTDSRLRTEIRSGVRGSVLRPRGKCARRFVSNGYALTRISNLFTAAVAELTVSVAPWRAPASRTGEKCAPEVPGRLPAQS